MPTTIEAFEQGLVGRITRLTRRQLEYWDQIGLVRPSVAGHSEGGRLPRLYSFTDLLKLKVAAEMRRRHVLPGEIKARIEELQDRGIDDPLLTLRIVGDPSGARGRAFWIHPNTKRLMSWKSVDQEADTYDLPIQDLRTGLVQTIRQLTRRRPGSPEKVRGVQGSTFVVKGTRVPTRKVFDLVTEGWSTREVVEALPRLTERDVSRAVSFEERRRQIA